MIVLLERRTSVFPMLFSTLAGAGDATLRKSTFAHCQIFMNLDPQISVDNQSVVTLDHMGTPLKIKILEIDFFSC